MILNYGIGTIAAGGMGRGYGVPRAFAADTYLEDFDSRQDEVTIDGVDSWRVIQADSSKAVVQSGLTSTGSGKALKLTGARTPVQLERSVAYGSLNPTWIYFRARPSVSSQRPDVPSNGIGAVCFDYTGRILASDGGIWVDTGRTFSVGSWYDVRMKLNFSTHRYDLYVTDALAADTQFIPLKSNLGFKTASSSSLSKLKFYGAYSASQSADVYIDEVGVLYFDRLGIVSPFQELTVGQASSPITAQLQNADSQPQTAPWDITLELKSTSSKGRFSLDPSIWSDLSQVVLAKNTQAVTFYYKDTAKGKPTITVSEYPEQGLTDGSQQLELINQVSYFDLEVSSPQVAGGFSFKDYR